MGNEGVWTFYVVQKSCVIWKAYIPRCLQLFADFYVFITNVDKINEFRNFRLDGTMRRDLDHFCYKIFVLWCNSIVWLFLYENLLFWLIWKQKCYWKKLEPWLEIFTIEPILSIGHLGLNFLVCSLCNIWNFTKKPHHYN